MVKKQSPVKNLIKIFRTGKVVRHHFQAGGFNKPMGTAKAYFKNVYGFQKNVIPAYSSYDRFARYCITGDTLIATNNEKGYLRIDEIVEKHKKGEDVYVFSYDKENNSVVCAKISNAWATKVDEIWEVELDNNTVLRCTKDHPIMLRDGSYREAQHLKSGDALMATDCSNYYPYKNKKNYYRKIKNFNGKNKSEHKIIAESIIGRQLDKNEVVHHKDFRGYDNSIDNIEIMTTKDHWYFHNKHNKHLSKLAKKRWAPGGDLRENVEVIQANIKKTSGWQQFVVKLKERNKKYKYGQFNKGRQDQKGSDNANCKKDITFQTICNLYKPGLSCKSIAKELNVDRRVVINRIKWQGYKSWPDFVENYTNHKVVSVKRTGKFEQVYDLTVPRYHNFAVCDLNDVKIRKSLIFIHNSDYAEMESYPVLNNALNIVADEVTQKDENGKIVKVFSKNETIQRTLTELFENILHLNGKNMWKLVRNLLKYGDTMYLLDITNENGIINLIQMPANEVEREEGFDREEPGAIRFRWTTKQNIELPNAYVAHFRLDGNDMYMPYGQCIASRNVVITKDGAKEIQDIKVGDYVCSFDTKEHRKIFSKVLDKIYSGKKNCYKISTKHNFVEASKEHKILIHRDNEFKYVSTLDIKIGDKLIISTNHKTENSFKIDKTKPLKEDFGQKINFAWRNINNIPDYVTPEFSKLLGFLFGDGYFQKCSKNRKCQKNDSVCFAMGINDSLNEYYINLMEKFSGNKAKIRKLSKEPENMSRVAYVHSVMFAEILHRLGFYGTAHTKRVPNWIFSANKEIQEAFVDGFCDADGCENIDKWNCKRYQIEICNENLLRDLKTLIQNLGYKSGKISKRERVRNNGLVVGNTVSYNLYYYKSLNEQIKKYDIKNRKTNDFILEPVVSIEKIGTHDVYDIYVENENHNFYANGIVVHNSFLEAARRPWRQLVLLEDSMMVYRITRAPERRVFKLDVAGAEPDSIPQIVNEFNKTIKKNKVVDEQGRVDLRYGATLEVDADYIIPVRGGESGTAIETLPGGQNMGDIEDIEFIRANLFAALGIPKAFLTFDQDIRSKQVLTQEDIRFARTVARIQEVIINELIKLAMIHLYIKGFRGSELVNYKIKMTNPSSVAELQKIELWRSRLELVSMAGEGVFDTSYIYKHFLSLSENEIEKIRKGQIQDKIFQAKLLKIENQQGAMPAEPGMAGFGQAGFGAPNQFGGMGGAQPEIFGGESVPVGEAAIPKKNLWRSSDGDSRTKEKRGLGDGQLGDNFIETDDDPNDMDGLKRTYSSPMGGRESINFESILKKYSKLGKDNPDLTSPTPLGLNEKMLEAAFKGKLNDKRTITLLKEASKEKITDFYSKLELELNNLEEKSNKIISEVYKGK